jgi:hypothetical protein
MQNFIKTMADWILDKEEAMAKSCAIPMDEIDAQLHQVLKQKAKLQESYEDSMANLNDIEAKLEKIKNIELLRCQKKQS